MIGYAIKQTCTHLSSGTALTLLMSERYRSLQEAENAKPYYEWRVDYKNRPYGVSCAEIVAIEGRRKRPGGGA